MRSDLVKNDAFEAAGGRMKPAPCPETHFKPAVPPVHDPLIIGVSKRFDGALVPPAFGSKSLDQVRGSSC